MTIGAKKAALIALTCIIVGGAIDAVPVSGATADASKNSQLRVALRQLHNAATRVKRAAVMVVNDVGQRPAAVETGDPRFFDPSAAQIQKNANLWAQELAQYGPLEPPRKSWLDADMTHLQHWVSILAEDVAAITPDQQVVIGDTWAGIASASADMSKHLSELQTLTAGPKYDNLAIAKAALSVRDDAVRVEALYTAADKCVRKK